MGRQTINFLIKARKIIGWQKVGVEAQPPTNPMPGQGPGGEFPTSLYGSKFPREMLKTSVIWVFGGLDLSPPFKAGCLPVLRYTVLNYHFH